jgi:hypothetical protein
MAAHPHRPGAHYAPSHYEVKFASLLQAIAEAKTQSAGTMMIHHPEALGDTYAELIESLNRIAAAELHLMILPPDQRGKRM